jgi:5-methyltetrahydropteroyltriglutamate--homocysteine methyltransferase
MSQRTKPPFRADHVGSLLKPLELHEARAKAAAGAITRAQLAEVEDRCVRAAVKAQEETGHHAITDGELRRSFWHVDFLTGIQGVVATKANYGVGFKGEHGETAATGTMLVVKEKLTRPKPIMLDHFKFLRCLTDRAAKFCMPAPTYLHMRGGRKVVDQTAYPDMDEFWADLATVYRAEIRDLGAAGCDYIQIDDVSFATLSDPEVREQIRRDGMDPDALPALYAKIINALIADRPAGMTATIHTCRGNHNSMWMASGGYDAVAEATFGGLDVDGFFLEYDSERAGGFEPLRFVPKGKRVVLGLISTKTPVLESKDELKRRIDAAAKFVPLDDLCLSPQCGFSSTPLGNRVSFDDQRRKLALVVEVAEEVWGSAV